MDVAVFQQLADELHRARRVLFITGAGISADSGLPTYRGVGGLYEDSGTEDGLSIEQALSGDMFRRRPDLTWKYLCQIEGNCRGAQPNRAHEVIAAMERERPFVMVLTQNVDGFHRMAGSRRVIEIHGNLHELQCIECGREKTVEDYGELAIPPRCPRCSGTVRPRVVLFGESLPLRPLIELQSAMEEGFDLVVSVGTSSLFPYIVEPLLAARERGATTVEINPGHTPVSEWVSFHLPLRAAPALEAWWQAYSQRQAATG